MQDVLDKIGINFLAEVVTYEFSLGNTDLNFNEKTNRLYIAGISEMDEFGKDLGFKMNDELSKINGKEIKIESIKEIITSYYESLKEGDKVSVEVYRPKGKKGKYKIKTLTAVAKKTKTVRKNQIALKQQLSGNEKQTLRAWVGL
jgi:hypothetical protein